MNEPIFIIGCGRTGSKIYLQTLNSHPDVGIGYEMHLINPWYKFISSDNLSLIKKFFPLKDNKDVEMLIDSLYSEKLNGSFWKHLRNNVEKDDVRNGFRSSDKNIESLLRTLLVETAKSKDGIIIGSKFPLHFAYVHKLKEWFPDCKIIHSMRDPRAILSSELKKSNKPNYPLIKGYKSLYDLGIITYVIIQWTWAIDCHFYYKKRYHDDYKLIKFENIVSNPVDEIKDLCNFLGIDFKREMLEINVRGSSHENIKRSGFDPNKISKWESKLPERYTKIIEFILSNKMKKIGYV